MCPGVDYVMGAVIDTITFQNKLKSAAISKLRQSCAKHLSSIFQRNLIGVES